jgi:hypothetical protein
MTGYQEMIVQDTKCDPKDAPEVEDIMRNIIFHSTLDWQSRAQFRKGAREAYEVLLAERSEPQDHSDDPCPCGDPDCSRPMGHEVEKV